MQHRDLTGTDLHIPKLHAATHLAGGTDPLPLIPGPQGLQGDTGPAGADSTVAGPQGVQGETGLTGTAGAKGDTGNAGAAGAKGDTGSQGSQGIQGIQGIQGSVGPTGVDGADSIVAGPQGIQGETGDTGSAGTTTWAGITDKPATFAPATHGHVRADVTDFPASMPASDVSAWAKAGTKPAYASSEITNISAAGRALIDDADAAAQRETLGLGTIAAGNTILTIEGDSISEGTLDPDLGRLNWPLQMGNLSEIFGRGTVYNFALGGDLAESMVTEYATQAHTVRPTLSGDQGYFFLMAGTNDIGQSVAAATIYNNLKTIWAAARADGFKVITFTILPSTGWTVGNGKETIRLALNALIKVDKTLYDTCVYGDILLPDASNGGYFLDGVHPTPAGSLILSHAVAIALSCLPQQAEAVNAYGITVRDYTLRFLPSLQFGMFYDTDFTPTITFGGNSVGITYYEQRGHYTKIGKMVLFSGWVFLSNKGSSTGPAAIHGIPFASQPYVGSAVTVSVNGITSVNSLSGIYDQNAHDYFQLKQTVSATGETSDITDANFTGNKLLFFSGVFSASA